MAPCTEPAEKVSVAPVIASGEALPLSRIAFAHSVLISSVCSRDLIAYVGSACGCDDSPGFVNLCV